MIIGRQFAERFYSENDYQEEERLYSTGDDKLDELLERAFCDGYEYAQREFAEEEAEEPKKKKHTGAKVAAGVGGAAVVGAGGVYGAEKLGKHWEKTGREKASEIADRLTSDGFMEKLSDKEKDALDKQMRKEAKKSLRGEKMQKPMKAVRSATDKAKKYAKKRVNEFKLRKL